MVWFSIRLGNIWLTLVVLGMFHEMQRVDGESLVLTGRK